MQELITLLLIGGISAIAALVQSATGSGYGIVAAPLLVLVDPTTVPGPLLVSTLVVMSVVIARHRHSLSLGDLLPSMIGAVPGIAVGALVAATVPVAGGMLAVGLIVLGGTVAAFTGVRIPGTPRALALAGAAAGVFTVVAATPGPPLAIVYQPSDVGRLRANLSAFFLVSSLGALIPLTIAPAQHWPPPGHTVALCLGVLPGVLAAAPLLAVLSARTVRLGSLGLCGIAGLTLTIRAVLLL